jgi:peptidoglycan/LPS O-acetylase OafA/YrhL
MVISTISDRLKLVNDRPSGFDYLRLFLSVGVIAIHGVAICYGSDAFVQMWKGPFHPLALFIVPSFFALSGFLVAGSLERNDIPTFLLLRFLRIFPALCVEVLISALILGVLFTTLPLASYFSHTEFWRYVGNIVGWVHYDLPGVFESRPPPNHVNGSLWTVPYELDCYIAIAALAAIGILRRLRILACILFAATVAGTIYILWTQSFWLGQMHPGGMLVLSFLFGAAIYLMRGSLPFSKFYFWTSLGASIVLLTPSKGIFLAAPFIAYTTVYLGLLNPRRTVLIKGSDYSYGIYLYGYPFQQTVFHLLPGGNVWIINVGSAVLLSGCAAYCSWTLVESKVLDHRRVVVDGFRSFRKRIRQRFSPASVTERS